MHPILGARCLTCHNQGKRSGGLSLDTYADTLGRGSAAIQPGATAGSCIAPADQPTRACHSMGLPPSDADSPRHD
jgi:hypothetical protein